MINVQVSEPFEGQVEPEALEKAAQAALNDQEAPDNSELTVVIEGDQAVHELNRQFLGIDAPTDVLSFPAGEEDPDTGNLYLGDIIISLPKAQAQAAAGGHDVSAELQLLVVHGVLHLLGMDHAEPEEKERMWSIQRGILNQLGVRITRWPED